MKLGRYICTARTSGFKGLGGRSAYLLTTCVFAVKTNLLAKRSDGKGV
jgi:hypothetical protein